MSSWRAWLNQPGRGEMLLRLALVAVFLALAARWWHPHYGFTRLLQLDVGAASALAPAVRAAPVFTYAAGERYDGAYYAQIATDPTLRDPHLRDGIDTVEYRARRIVAPALAFVLAGGEPAEALRIYAGLNLAAWLALAAVLWVLLPPGNWKNLAAWTGILFSAGALHSARLALVDLPALVVLAGALLAVERKRWFVATALFALAGLTRETTLLAAAGVAWTCWGRGERERAVGLAVAAVPALAWVAWLRARFGGGDGGGWDNFDVPFSGLFAKLVEVTRAFLHEGDTVLVATTALTVLALLVQASFFVTRRPRGGAWVCVGVVFAALLVVLDIAVWEGHPGAVTRVLLPLTLAFFVAAVRTGASWRWFVAGALSLPAGVLAWLQVPSVAGELTAVREAGGSRLVRVERGFFPVERAGGRHWAWSRGAAEIAVETWPRVTRKVAAELELRAVDTRRVEVRQDARVLWVGEVGPKRQTVRLEDLALVDGRARLMFTSEAAPVREGGTFGRELSFAVFDLRPE